jgi:hypothetical protein
MKAVILLIPREVLLMAVGYLLENEEQPKTCFKQPMDWKNFLNSCRMLKEWKKESQIVMLNSFFSLKFMSSSMFQKRILESVANSLKQLKVGADGLAFQKINLKDGTFLRVEAEECSFISFPETVSELRLRSCFIKDSRVFPSERKVDLTQFLSPASIDVQNLQVQEEAKFSGINLINYHALSHLKSISVSHTDSIFDVSFFKASSRTVETSSM